MAALKLLFVCIGNTCRSPIAEAIARALGGGQLEVFSAGIAPTGVVSPRARLALERLGYPAGALSSKGLDAVPLEEMDVMVSLLGRDGLHYLPRRHGARLEAWPIRDPFGEDLEVFVATARAIERRVRRLLAELAPGELPAL